MEEAPEGTETKWREGLERREDVSGQEGCMLESLKKSMVAEGRGWRADTDNSGGARGGIERAGKEHLPQHSEMEELNKVAGELRDE